mmetsp:Transcript_33091/g.69217  ORF Transcript_33091/g.69217 Transcript_33091/m.69217 type:complete len:90 (-) Transcript_33091:6572-6841(-)
MQKWVIFTPFHISTAALSYPKVAGIIGECGSKSDTVSSSNFCTVRTSCSYPSSGVGLRSKPTSTDGTWFAASGCTVPSKAAAEFVLISF